MFLADLRHGSNSLNSDTVLFMFIFVCTAVLNVCCVLQVSIAGLCREAGALFYCGAATQIGSAGGALTAFILVTQVQKVVFLTRKVFISVNFFIASYKHGMCKSLLQRNRNWK